MCSRLRNIQHFADIALALNVARINSEYNSNVAPTEMTPTVQMCQGKGRKAKLARFGINLRSPDGKPRAPLLNSRMDTLRRGSFSKMVNRQRCIIPAEGFYEWREENGQKQPYFFHRKDGQPLMLAGIWDYSDVKGDTISSFSILTDESNELIAPYHDRMPVATADPEAWLIEGDDPLDRLKPIDLDLYAVRRVNRAVNKPTEKDLAKIEEPEQG